MFRDGGFILSVIMVAIFAGFTAMAWGYSPEARLAPLVVGILGLAFTLAQLVKNVRGWRTDGDGRTAGDRTGRILLAWLGGFVAATILVGIVPTALLLVFAFLRFRGREPLRTAAVVAVLFAAVLYVTFEMALGMSLFAGALRGGF